MAGEQKGISLGEDLPWMDVGPEMGQLWGEAELTVSPLGTDGRRTGRSSGSFFLLSHKGGLRKIPVTEVL